MYLSVCDPQGHASPSPLAIGIGRAQNQQLSLPELFEMAEGLKLSGRGQDAVELYTAWIAFNSDSPHLHLVYFNLSVSLRMVGDSAGAINALLACTRLDPLFGPSHINLGRAFEDSGQLPSAIRQWQDYVDRTSSVTADAIAHRLMALQHIGRVLENAEFLANAEDALRLAVELRPDRTEAAQHWIALRQRQCKWPVLAPSEQVTTQQWLAAMSPMSLAAYADDPIFQLAKAYKYNKSFVGSPGAHSLSRRLSNCKVGTGQRLRIGYVSSDLRDHAVGFALSEVFELHDKKRVEIYAYYCGDAHPGDLTQMRIQRTVDRWRDIAQLSDYHAAAQIAADEIDILVDLNGYTKNARTKIFSYRPAPVIVNWCGYPGTMGSPYHQYLIADDVIIPPENEIFYSEKVVRIPCNQPIDRKRIIGAHPPTRADAGLPETAFVFASFNGMQKLTARCFQRWMRILIQAPDSVLWLLSGTEDTNARLRSAAARQNVASDRLIFAPKAANPEHLARLALADLFLDSSPYGAHSTAADALSMGLPILTLPGKSFASRFCSSVVRAAGLQDLICATEDIFIDRAVAFARNPASLETYRTLLQRSRDNSVLHAIPALVQQLEERYWEMQADCERGAAPIPDLTNLDIYYEIGASINLEDMEALDSRAYRRLYRDRLEQSNDFSPLPTDSRFWPKSGTAGSL